jgi:large subunit ribosomal protein L10
MKREDKSLLIDNLAGQIAKFDHFYVTDISGLNAEKTSTLRRRCFERGIVLVTVKNTLFRKALEQNGEKFNGIHPTLKGSSSIMFSESANLPAKLIKEFRKNSEKPLIKSAYVEESIYVGDNQLDNLVNLKSKAELVGDILALLQSPAKNVISALQSGGNILHGVLETLSKKE